MGLRLVMRWNVLHHVYQGSNGLMYTPRELDRMELPPTALIRGGPLDPRRGEEDLRQEYRTRYWELNELQLCAGSDLANAEIDAAIKRETAALQEIVGQLGYTPEV
jgi:hypothetical protein